MRRRERTSAELTAWLHERGYPDEDIEQAVRGLTESGALDDERFAHGYAQDKRELRGWGRQRIREALAGRGVAPALIDTALGADTHEAEVERASALLVQRDHPLGGDADRARALGFLTRRGYDYDAAYEAVRAAARGDE